jgi:predicted metalloprotease
VSSLIRPRLFAGAALLLVLGGAWQLLGSANAGATKQAKERAGALKAPAGAGAHDLILGSKDSAQPKNMEQFLTAVTKDVDTYWTKVFKDSGLPEPKVGYKWIPAGQTAASACGDANGTLGDSAAAYCSADDTIYISQKFATEIYTGALDQALPGSSQGYGRTVGDFAVAYMVAHEYGHEVQDELGLFDEYGQQLPAMAFELQADCYAGTWANSAYEENRLQAGDVQEALDATLAVGDFDTGNPNHHGTPEQREQAWNSGFESGDPSSCSQYLDPSTLGDDGAASQQDPSAGYPQGDPGSGYPQEDPPQGDPSQVDPSQADPSVPDPSVPYGVVAGRS